MSLSQATQALIDEFRSRPTLRAGSLITTVFGDSVAPRGGSVWLGSLIRVMRTFGISERLVRTSVYRLSRDGWFEVSQIGRRSYYSLSEEGKRKFEHATTRIYSEPAVPWSGEWCLLMTGGLNAKDRDWLKKEAEWLGFAVVAGNVLAHPATALAELEPLLEKKGVRENLVVMHASLADCSKAGAMRDLVQKSWNLQELDERYAAFVHHFSPVADAIRNAGKVDPANAFQIRTLLIQEYRKVLLRDPLLPSELLPDDWHGSVAYRFCRDLYLSVYAQADDWLSGEMETQNGALPRPAPAFFDRFGGLIQEHR